MSETSARRIHVTGVVQGVGFRPFIYTLAIEHNLTGWVRNTSAGVDIEIEGPSAQLDAFTHAITEKAPPLARIESVKSEEIGLTGEYNRFEIRHSHGVEGAYQPISPDVAICDDCLKEILDPTDRRHRYAFTNCTNCGPRFTIIQDIPYDRPKTTMAEFKMCPECQAEYDNPLNRRFHAQPNACPVCGPRLELLPSPDHAVPGEWDDLPWDEIDAARELLKEGHILAIKGLGGFHLACDATNPDAVRRLRERKGRAAKPFALMMPNLEMVMQYCAVSFAAAEALAVRERPIVLLPLRPHPALNTEHLPPLANDIAPGLRELGVMLPYTPLHHLLLQPEKGFPPALVMTSGNYSEEPIATGNADAIERLGPMVDAFLVHDRDIYIRNDDSVIRPLRGGTQHSIMPLRRSRGYAPYPVALPFAAPPMLACGAEMKNTFCITRDKHAFMSQHIGDLANYDALQSYEHSIRHMEHLFRVQPEVVVHDAHPDYMASKYAVQRAEKDHLTRVAVQHHHAHLASCIAENQLPPDEPVIGVIFDGTGLGPDNAIWGGEFLIGSYTWYRRFAHLKYIPLPGGDAATQRPYRTALAHLWQAGIAWDDDLPPIKHADSQERTIIRQQIERKINAPLTSSMGRLFDATAALAGVLQVVTYEAQGAIQLEAQVDESESGSYIFDLLEPNNPQTPWLIDPAPVLRSVRDDLRGGVAVPVIAARFHNSVADMIRDMCIITRRTTGIKAAVLSGGVFQNATLYQKTIPRLEEIGMTVYTHHLVPPNDGGLALGQAAIAAYQVLHSDEN
ncbi:MAG: carbamoyltransferase HypF [Anaerolineae bacterium]|nr:carbamoyltransferase HypF [Anaerolineae bacterium]